MIFIHVLTFIQFAFKYCILCALSVSDCNMPAWYHASGEALFHDYSEYLQDHVCACSCMHNCQVPILRQCPRHPGGGLPVLEYKHFRGGQP